MSDWFRFIFGNKRLLNFGFLFNFFSSFGQTFFISLFVPFWVVALGITNAAFGSMYAAVTIVSAFLLSVVGRFIDKMSLRRYATIVFSGLALAVIILSQAHQVWVLLLGLLLVRWFGQGLMTHTSATGIAKLFDDNRGKALGLTALGHPAGQFVLPLLVAPLIGLFDWRLALLFLLAIAALVVIPSVYALNPVAPYKPENKTENKTENKSENKTNEADHTAQPSYLLTARFWLIAANLFIVPFLNTAIFLYQYSIAETKGWSSDWVLFSFAFFAIFNALALLASGSMVDRYSGIRLFPLYLIPGLLALLIMSFVNSPWVFPVFYALLGISTGLGSTVKTALQVEVYGKGSLGKIRSYFSTIMVFSTALGPPAFGFFLDRDWSFNTVMLISALVVSLLFMMSFSLWKLLRKSS